VPPRADADTAPEAGADSGRAPPGPALTPAPSPIPAPVPHRRRRADGDTAQCCHGARRRFRARAVAGRAPPAVTAAALPR
jgi:hypothetical protein